MPGTTHDGVEAKLIEALEVGVAAFVVAMAPKDKVSPLPTAFVAFAASVTVVPEIEDTVPIFVAVVTSYTGIPKMIHEGVELKLRTELDVGVAALVIAVSVALGDPSLTASIPTPSEVILEPEFMTEMLPLLVLNAKTP